MRRSYERDTKLDLENREKKNKAYKETLKKREMVDNRYNDNGEEWTANMPEKT